MYLSIFTLSHRPYLFCLFHVLIFLPTFSPFFFLSHFIAFLFFLSTPILSNLSHSTISFNGISSNSLSCYFSFPMSFFLCLIYLFSLLHSTFFLSVPFQQLFLAPKHFNTSTSHNDGLRQRYLYYLYNYIYPVSKMLAVWQQHASRFKQNIAADWHQLRPH